ncbi:MAG: hypothetical protein HY254_20790 [Burkholderiales bacterium]|nr:hypothetical protein [Burkholderiales bacterium]
MKLNRSVARPGLYGSRRMRVMPYALDNRVYRILRLVRGSIPDCTARHANLHGRENAVPKVDINMH